MDKQINKILSKCQNIAIIGHINPDGDCFGSMSAVNDYIKTKYNQCNIHCFADCNIVAEELRPFTKDLVFNPTPLSKYDCCFCVDTADLGRLGKFIEVFNCCENTICIDHHATNKGFATLNYINIISSNCENVYNMLKQAKFNINPSTAGKLFAGIVTDTNNLSTSSVTDKTFLAVADLCSLGINRHRIYNHFMDGNSKVQFKLLSIAMNSAEFYNNDTIMVMKISSKDLAKVGGKQEDLNCIINQAYCIKDVKSALLISPRGNQSHVSFRSRGDVDVSIVAQHFGGGGHLPAAAFTAPTFTKKDLAYIIDNLTNQINNLPKEKNNLF